MGHPEGEVDTVEIHLHEGRHLPPQYLNLVRSRWMRSYRHCNDYMKLIHAAAYYSAYHAYVMSVLNRPNVTVRLAVLGDDDDVVLGFSVTESSILHYVEVKRDYRKQGIGKYLVPDKISWFTHLTKIGLKIWSTKAPEANFNPYA